MTGGPLMVMEKQHGGQCLEGRRQGEREGVRFRGQGRPAQARPLALNEWAPSQASELKSCVVRLNWGRTTLAAMWRTDESVNGRSAGRLRPQPRWEMTVGTLQKAVWTKDSETLERSTTSP